MLSTPPTADGKITGMTVILTCTACPRSAEKLHPRSARAGASWTGALNRSLTT